MKEDIIKVIIVIVGVISLWFLLNINYAASSEQELTNAKLENVMLRTKSGSKHSSGEVYYLYTFTTDDGKTVTCKNKDSLYLLKYNSGDYEAILTKGNRYDIKYRGARWHFFSTYPNIISVEKK